MPHYIELTNNVYKHSLEDITLITSILTDGLKGKTTKFDTLNLLDSDDIYDKIQFWEKETNELIDQLKGFTDDITESQQNFAPYYEIYFRGLPIDAYTEIMYLNSDMVTFLSANDQIRQIHQRSESELADLQHSPNYKLMAEILNDIVNTFKIPIQKKTDDLTAAYKKLNTDFEKTITHFIDYAEPLQIDDNFFRWVYSLSLYEHL